MKPERLVAPGQCLVGVDLGGVGQGYNDGAGREEEREREMNRRIDGYTGEGWNLLAWHGNSGSCAGFATPGLVVKIIELGHGEYADQQRPPWDLKREEFDKILAAATAATIAFHRNTDTPPEGGVGQWNAQWAVAQQEAKSMIQKALPREGHVLNGTQFSRRRRTVIEIGLQSRVYS